MAKFNVLVVDDEKHFQDMLCDWINSWGHITTVASSGMEALEAVKNNKFNVVLLDYRMPGMDGLATLKELRKLDSKVEVIMLTGYPDEKWVSDGSKLEISFYVTKFHEITDVHNILETAFNMIEKKLSYKDSSGG